ncbi:hypothetical protein [Porphyromonas endodontalis]|uniref:hypothetical protein n=1 Tax=Porphyromonas endodontalis TaxID=28124 RepID=UPI0028F002A6|nr:hypothetical protein [Porphyromonas endodontalis]
MKFILLSKGTNKNRNNKKNANPADFKSEHKGNRKEYNMRMASGQEGRGRQPEIQKRISRKVLRLLPKILQKIAREIFYSCPKKGKAHGSKIRAFHS